MLSNRNKVWWWLSICDPLSEKLKCGLQLDTSLGNGESIQELIQFLVIESKFLFREIKLK